jgi:ribosomal protein L35AE/L33A
MSENKTAYLTQIHKRMVIGDIMTEMLQCSAAEIDTIIRMVDLHGIEVAEEAAIYVNNSVDLWSFGAFVVGTQRRVIDRIRDRISTEMTADLDEIVLDEEKYGRINFYKDCDMSVAQLFADMCVNGTVEERIGELISYDVEYYGGRKDDPDMEKLIDGLASMMCRHGIRGNVRAKAKEFLAAVATDALNEVIHEE